MMSGRPGQPGNNASDRAGLAGHETERELVIAHVAAQLDTRAVIGQPLMRGELPLRVIDAPGGPVIRCLCGAESAVVRPAAEMSAAIIRAGRGSRITNRGLSPDVSPAAVLRMVAHAKVCQRGQNASES